mmetsp:Transcript_42349/g.99891  ORF Transcript_42349/g.99891 Transcript_42349/m.99891 type:complete len:225 (-) Transcript_42349:218-892(-)
MCSTREMRRPVHSRPVSQIARPASVSAGVSCSSVSRIPDFLYAARTSSHRTVSVTQKKIMPRMFGSTVCLMYTRNPNASHFWLMSWLMRGVLANSVRSWSRMTSSADRHLSIPCMWLPSIRYVSTCSRLVMDISTVPKDQSTMRMCWCRMCSNIFVLPMEQARVKGVRPSEFSIRIESAPPLPMIQSTTPIEECFTAMCSAVFPSASWALRRANFLAFFGSSAA